VVSSAPRRDSRGPDEPSSLRRWISLETATLFVETIETLVDLVDDPTEIQAETRDPNDDYLIALARANDVDLIISGDNDLLDWKLQRPPVVTPVQFEQHLHASMTSLSNPGALALPIDASLHDT
jgi:predicted nucleic acid-binding protein